MPGMLQARDVPKVIQYSDRRSHREQWKLFRHEVLKCPTLLFITVADECHWGPKAYQAHDKMVNDYASEEAAAGSSTGVRGSLLQQENYFVLLVSATPYNVISKGSRIPEEYMVIAQPDQGGLRLHDILRQGARYLARVDSHTDTLYTFIILSQLSFSVYFPLYGDTVALPVCIAW